MVAHKFMLIKNFLWEQILKIAHGLKLLISVSWLILINIMSSQMCKKGVDGYLFQRDGILSDTFLFLDDKKIFRFDAP